MVSKSIELFQFNQKYCQTIGIHMAQTKKDRHTVNSIRLVFSVVLLLYSMASVAYVVYDAETISDYGACFFVLIAVAETVTMYLVTISKWKDILIFTENCERFIEKRKLKEQNKNEMSGHFFSVQKKCEIFLPFFKQVKTTPLSIKI